jgi:ATP-dependent Lon protease
MEKFKRGLNQFWVGAVFGVCLAISLVLIPIAIIMSNINDVLKIHEVNVLVEKVSTVFDKSEQAISNAKAALTDFDNDVVMDMLTAVQSYQQQTQSLLSFEQKQVLKEQIKEQLAQQLKAKLNEQQTTFILSVFEKLANTKKGAQALPN